MSIKLGLEAKMYYMRGGLAGGGTWTELDIVRDVTLNIEKSEADVTTRGNDGWRAIKGALKTASIEFQMPNDPDDAGFDAIQNAFILGSTIALAVMDGPILTGNGLQADCEILQFPRAEPLEEAQTVDVVAKPTYSATPPQFVEAGGTPTGT